MRDIRPIPTYRSKISGLGPNYLKVEPTSHRIRIMEEFTAILHAATSALGLEYFLLPIHGSDPVYRERVYCYELYHQMRQNWPPDSPYRLNGEVDKIAHPYFQDGTAPKPDFLVHQPGTGINHAVIEVKTCQAAVAGITKDFATLNRFLDDFGYERAIYLLYGEQAEATLEIAANIATEIPRTERIEIWLHTAAGIPAVRAR